MLVADRLAQKRLWLLLMSELFGLSNHRFKSKVNCRAAAACNGALIDIRIVQRGDIIPIVSVSHDHSKDSNANLVLTLCCYSVMRQATRLLSISRNVQRAASDPSHWRNVLNRVRIYRVFGGLKVSLQSNAI